MTQVSVHWEPIKRLCLGSHDFHMGFPQSDAVMATESDVIPLLEEWDINLEVSGQVY